MNMHEFDNVITSMKEDRAELHKFNMFLLNFYEEDQS